MMNWQARWITDETFASLEPIPMLHKENDPPPPGHRPHPEELRNRHVYFRKRFTLERQPLHATLRITADDYYKLYVNGRFVGQGPAQGYPSHYYYNEWPLEDWLQTGDNTIAVHVYYQGHINRVFNSGDLRMGLAVELRVDDVPMLSTDESWRCHPAEQFGPAETVGYDTQYLEHIDERRSIRAWRLASFDDAAWPTASAQSCAADYHLEPQPTPPLSVYRQPPLHIETLADGHLLIDFGRELTGQLTLTARGEPGQIIELRYGEELESGDRAVRYDMRCNCRYVETWTLSGETDELDNYDYKTFRYAEILAPAGVVATDSIAAIVRHYPLDEDACRFETSDPMLQQIWDICRRGVQLCSQEGYVDCPSREKGQYLGDNTIIGPTHMYISGDMQLFKKAIREFARSAAICPGLLAVTPGNYMQEIADYSLQWPMQVLAYYRYSGDLAFLQEMYPIAERMLDYFRAYAREDGLLHNLNDKWNMVDWPDNLRDGYDFPLTRPGTDGCHNVLNSYYYGCIQTIQTIRELLGVPYEDELPRLRRAFVEAFYREETGLFVDAVGSSHHSLHANALPLLFGLAPERAIEPILELIAERRFSCGVYMSYFVMKALAAHARTEMIYELIMGEDERSWSNMVREGATTCYEAWGKEQKWNTSLCHGWAAAPIPLLIEDILGLQPAEPGWGRVRFAPRLPQGMPDFNLRLPTPRGPILVAYAGGELTLEAPAGVEVIDERR